MYIQNLKTEESLFVVLDNIYKYVRDELEIPKKMNSEDQESTQLDQEVVDNVRQEVTDKRQDIMNSMFKDNI